MKYYLFIFLFMASTLRAEMINNSEVSYPYDIEINKDDSVIKYLVDSTYYDRFSTEVLGVYVINNNIPMRITKDLKKMAKILDRYIDLSSSNQIIDTNDTQMNKFKEIISTDIFHKYSKKYMNNHSEMRDINRLLRNTNDYKEITNLFNKLENYINKKKDLYHRQNNKDGISFCKEIKKTILNPLAKINSVENITDEIFEKSIKRLSKRELKIVWDEFKNSNLGLIKTYFNANNDKLVQLDANNLLEIDLNYLEWNGLPKYYICLRIFGQKWYLKISDYYVSDLHKVSMIQL